MNLNKNIPAADTRLADRINDAISRNEVIGSARDWIAEKLGPKLKTRELDILRVGYIFCAENKVEPGQSTLTWRRYLGDQAEGLELDEPVTVLDHAGEPIVSKVLADFTAEELVKYSAGNFWKMERDVLPCTRVTSLSAASYMQIQAKQQKENWIEEIDEVLANHDFLAKPGVLLQFFPEVVTLEKFGMFRYLGEDGSELPLLDPTRVVVYDRNGKEIVRKAIEAFSDAEFVLYCTGHIWSYEVE
jgi:hypothetical protein